MPELPSLLRQRLQTGDTTRLQHPDADTLTAYVEQLLPAAERKLVLQHISVCGDCREIVFLATPENTVVAGPEAVVPEQTGSPMPARRRWFLTPGLGLAASIAAMAVAVTLVLELPHKNQPVSVPTSAVSQISSVEAPKVSDAKEAASATQSSSPLDSNAPASSVIPDSRVASGSAVRPESAGLRASADAPARPASERARVGALVGGVVGGIPAGKADSDTRRQLRPEIMAQIAAADSDQIGKLSAGSRVEVTSAAPVLEAKASRQDYLNAQRFSKDAADPLSAAAGKINLPSAPAPSLNGLANGQAFSGQSTLLSGNFQQSSNAYLVIPETQQQITQGALTFTPQAPEHHSLLSKIVEVGKRPIKRAEPALQAQNVSRFAMFNNGLSVQHNDQVPATETADLAEAPSLAKSPAFTARGFGSSRKAFLGAASIYRWKVTQGKLLKSADAVIWLPGYAETESIEFSAVHSSGLEIWAGGNHGQLVHSVDGGNTWVKVSLGDAAAGNVVSIENTGLNVHVVTAPSQGWSSVDSGKTWTKLPQ